MQCLFVYHSNTLELILFKTRLLQGIFHNAPRYMLRGGGVLSCSGEQYKLSFMQPQNTKFPYQRLGIIRESDFADFTNGREFGRRFQLFMDGQDSPWQA